jgi:hypothetical protein
MESYEETPRSQEKIKAGDTAPRNKRARSVESGRGPNHSVQIPDLEDRRTEISASLSRERSRRRSSLCGMSRLAGGFLRPPFRPCWYRA